MKKLIAIAFLTASFFSPYLQAANEADAANSQASEKPIQTLLNHALDTLGVPYHYGGKTPSTGLDCSGLVKYVFQNALNMILPHSALAISRLGQKIAFQEIQPGDLVFFNTLRRTFSHVGIYLGNGQFVHAPSTGGKVMVSNLNDQYWAKHFQGVRRLASQAIPAENPANSTDSTPSVFDE